MSKLIELSFSDKTLSNLTGNKYGRTTFNKQVKEYISYDEPIVIVFPDYIDNIGSSFIQGFFDEMVGKIGIHGIQENVEIRSNTIKNIKEHIIKKLSI